MKTMNKLLSCALGLGMIMSLAVPGAFAHSHRDHHNGWGRRGGWGRYDRGYGGYGRRGGGWNNCRRDRWSSYNDRRRDRRRASGYGGGHYDGSRRGYW